MMDRRSVLKSLAALGVAVPFFGTGSSGNTISAMAQESTISTMAQVLPSSRQVAGQRVIYSYPGLSVPDALLQAIRDGEAAGVIFFGENITNDDQIAAVVAQLREAQEQSPISAPLLLMTDQEGGLVRRLPGAPELSAKQVGQSGDPEKAAGEAGAETGQHLASVGMNVNLAPVLGVYRESGDFLDQYERSFSDDAATVSVCGRAFIAAQQSAGVAATAKHFPGLGAASSSQNTDATPVTLPVSLPTLRAVDEAPYSAAIDADVKLIMISWALYTALDADFPAGLSSTIVRGELRERVGYQGVTITDAIEAGSLGEFGDDSQRAVLAAQAGMDLILCSARDVSQGQNVMAALANALDSGQLDGADFSAAVERVNALRSGLTTSRYFLETGRWVSGGFLSYWTRFGGLPSLRLSDHRRIQRLTDGIHHPVLRARQIRMASRILARTLRRCARVARQGTGGAARII